MNKNIEEIKKAKNDICDRIEDFAYDCYKEFGIFDETDLAFILCEIRREINDENREAKKLGIRR